MTAEPPTRTAWTKKKIKGLFAVANALFFKELANVQREEAALMCAKSEIWILFKEMVNPAERK